MTATPRRRHRDCEEPDCRICLDDHSALLAYFEREIGHSSRSDWLGRYRSWLDAHGIPAETHGWGSREAWTETYIAEFIREFREEAS